MTDPVSILAATENEALFAPWFKNRDTWISWFSFLAALFALPMTPPQLKIFQDCTGRTAPSSEPLSAATLVCGRRSGKSFILALISVFLACFRDYRQYLQPGERCTVMIISVDRRQSRVIFRYIKGLLHGVPALAQMITRETSESFDLDNGVTIEVATMSHRSTRGYATCAILADEMAFWRSDESASPDFEIVAALRPSMATIPGAMLLVASSPYAQRGYLWEDYRRYYGHDEAPVLVWKAATQVMNSTVPQSVIDAEYERDPAYAEAEYGGNFRSDVTLFLERAAVQACIQSGTRERLPERAVRNYVMAIDPAGGSGQDSMTCAVAHMAGSTVVLDAVREVKPKFSPEAVVDEFSALAKRYRVVRIYGDRWGGEFCREPFRRAGLNFECVTKPKSDFYLDFAPLINSGAVDLLDNDRLVQQLCGLERKTARSGRDSIDHGPGAQHDDVANSAAIACVLAQSRIRPEPGRYGPMFQQLSDGRMRPL
jgi:hypothetical protein